MSGSTPFATINVSSDLHTALLGAHGGLDGAVMITGTGSCAALLAEGEVIQFGGYGFQLGDQASGAWLGQRAVQQALLSADGLSPVGRLWPAVCEFYDCQSPAAVVDLLNTARPGEFARFAPTVFALSRHDKAASDIVDAGATYLNALAQRCLADQPVSIVLTGGLAELWLPCLAEPVQARVANAQFGPEWGAVYLAQTRSAASN